MGRLEIREKQNNNSNQTTIFGVKREVLGFLKRKTRQKIEVCPVCKGSGKYEAAKCHGCAGQGWLFAGDVSRAVNVNQNKNEVYDRKVGDVTISVAEGLDNTKAITVTGWNEEDAFNLFKRVRKELKAAKK